MVPKIAKVFVVVTIILGLAGLVLGILALIMGSVVPGIANIIMGLALMVVGMTLRGVLDAMGQMGQGMAGILKALNTPR
jgi:hypothetical protein